MFLVCVISNFTRPARDADCYSRCFSAFHAIGPSGSAPEEEQLKPRHMSVWPAVVLLAGSKCQFWSSTAVSLSTLPGWVGKPAYHFIRKPAGVFDVLILLPAFMNRPGLLRTAHNLRGRCETCQMITAQDEQTLPRRDMESWTYRHSRLSGLFCQSRSDILIFSS